MKKAQEVYAHIAFKNVAQELSEWRSERCMTIDIQRQGFTPNVFEELTEYYRATNDNEKIDALCDIAVFSFNVIEIDTIIDNLKELYYKAYKIAEANDFHSEPSMYNLGRISMYASALNTLYDENVWKTNITEILISVISEVFALGYDFFKCMDETIREISSRTGQYDTAIGKWVKDTSDEAKAKWYKANYENCKIKI